MKAVILLAACGACASAPTVSRARFANAPIVWRAVARVDVTEPPPARPFAQKIYFFDAYTYEPVANALSLPGARHALDVNAVDEVPSSSWFENRIGSRNMSLDEIRRGPNQQEIDASTLTIIQSKTVGGSAGFIVLDGRGDRYVIKLDEPQAPVTESATDVAVQRLLWAIGYHVPENSVIYFRREQLVLSPKAVVKDEFGNERAMELRDLDKTLGRGYVRAGRYRALASKYLRGKPLGGWPQRGVREGDPNDRIPHEHMRVIRALYLFFAWLQQTDVKEDNTLDMWIEEDGRHYVKHHLVDFGKSLGMSAWIALRPGDGHQQNLDYSYVLRGLVSLGLWVRPYEGTLTPNIQGVGTFDADHFNPAKWEPHANYIPLSFVDDRDLLWAAKILARFTPAQIRAAIEQGRYEDPRAVDYLTEVLVARQRIAIRWVFTRVAALDRFKLDGSALCFDDLLIAYDLKPGARALTKYVATAYDYAGKAIATSAEARMGVDRTACVGPIPGARDHEGYTIMRIATTRGTRTLNAVEVHVATDPATRQPRIIGIHRE